MQTFRQQLAAHTTIIPIRSENKIKTVTKLEDGGLRCEQHSGNTFVIPASEPDQQAFAIYSVLANGF